MTVQHRNLSVSDVLGVIKGFDLATARPVFSTLLMGLDGLVRSYARKPEKEQAYIRGRFEKLLTKPDMNQRLLAASLQHKITSAYRPLPMISKWLRTCDMDVNARVHGFNGFLNFAFDGANSFSAFQRLKLDRHCRQIYRSIYTQARREFAEPMGTLKTMPPLNAKRVALCTAQFLGRRHAPTGHILSMADVLTQMGYEVKIFNQALAPRFPASGTFLPYIAPKLAKLNEISTLALASGNTAAFWQNPHEHVSAEAFSDFAREIVDFAPGHLISLGPANLYADLVGVFIPNASMPTTIDIAISNCGAYGCVRPLTSLQLHLLKPLGISAERLIDLPSGFARPDTAGPMPRGQFNLAETDYAVAIVTNRANADLSDDYLSRLEAALSDAPSIQVRILGSSNTVTEAQMKRFAASNQLKFCGFLEDLHGALGCFDAVLNPPRLGGGTSAAYAMDLGLNLFTLDDCDVANVAGPDFVYPDINATLEALKLAAVNAEEKQRKSEQAKARWRVISDREGQMRRMLDGALRTQA